MTTDIKEIVANMIDNESEYSHLDFKREQYPIDKNSPKKPEFLKDIMAFANLNSKENKFIIIGVEEVGGMADNFLQIDTLNDQATYQQYVNEYIEPEINFEYSEITHKGNKLAYFRLFNNDQFPYLFKKDLNQNGFRFDTGSGFVRAGTSTRKLKRDDFEKMYALRHTTVKDRSEDLSFRIINTSFDDYDLARSPYRHLQINAINHSNKSIEFDVEVKIAKSKNFRVMLTQEVEKKNYQQKRDAEATRGFMVSPSYNVAPPTIYMDMHVEHSNDFEYDLFSRTPERFKTIAVFVKQNSETKDIFNGQIAINYKNTSEIHLEIIARSDDFPNGPLIKKYIFPKLELYD